MSAANQTNLPGQALFGSRAAGHEQRRVLEQALASLASAAAGHRVAAFDLDSTLLNNKSRQARIVREWGALHGDERLLRCPPSAVVSWDIRDSARLCGLTDTEAELAYPSMKEFWRERFFTSDYCQDDEPIAGARQFLERALAVGGELVYITGRHTEMGPGTVVSFERAGFPLPDGGRVQLWLKPKPLDDDDRWKELCHARLRALSGLACAFDNEPTHVNAYKRAFPDAVVVHLDTDHSQRPVEVLESIPSVADFRLEPR